MFTEGICQDGAAILKDGEMVPIDAILTMLNALEKINNIRNSIVGLQNVYWSAHVYPLAAALNEAGFQGQEYDVARKEACTLLEQRDRLQAVVDKIAKVASGEDQVADDDTEGMIWIRQFIAESV